MNVYRKTKPFIFCIISAVILVLAFPHTSWNFLAWIGLVLFLSGLDGASPCGAFGRGYFFGFLFYLGTIWWIGHVTVVGMLLLVAYLALYYALFGLGYRFVARFSLEVRLILIPTAYVVLEFIRDHALTGFGWASLGHTQANFSALLYVCEWTGVAGLSFLVVLGNVVLKEWLSVLISGSSFRDSGKKSLVFGVVFLGLVIAGGVLLGVSRDTYSISSSRPITTVALVQPNVMLGEMWSESSKPLVVKKLLAMSRRTLKDHPDLIIWPETSFPHFYWELPDLLNEVTAFAREHKVSLLIGAVTREGDKYFNSAILISPEGRFVKIYSKRHLVLFGEYIPFRKELPFLASIVPIDDFTPGAQDTLFELPNGAKFSVLICFEDTLPELGRQDVLKGADFLVNMTNDAWFGNSGQPRMHLLNALLRSAENYRPLVRATNTGESCTINAGGKIRTCVEDAGSRRVLVEGIAVDRVGGAGRVTFYTKYGDVFTLLCGLGILITTIICIFSQKGEGIWMILRQYWSLMTKKCCIRC